MRELVRAASLAASGALTMAMAACSSSSSAAKLGSIATADDDGSPVASGTCHDDGEACTHPDAAASRPRDSRDAEVDADASAKASRESAAETGAPSDATRDASEDRPIDTGPIPPVSPLWTNTHPPPAGWRPVSYDGLHAPDAYHIRWAEMCSSGVLNCDGADPAYASGSSAAMSDVMMGNSVGMLWVCDAAGLAEVPGSPTGQKACGNGDFTAGVYFVESSDPAYKIACDNGWGGCGWGTSGSGGNLGGESIPISKRAIPGFDGDQHLFLLNEADATECSLWEPELGQGNAVYALTGPGSLTVGNGACGSLTQNEEGVGGPFEVYASSTEPVSVLVRPEELLGPNEDGNGYINHALYMSLAANKSGTFYYPAANSDGACGGAGTNVEGEVIYLDTAGYAILLASNAAPWKKTWLAAAHDFGFYDLDSSGCGGPWSNFLAWGGQSYVTAGIANPWEKVESLAKSDGNPNDFGSDANGNNVDQYNLDLGDTGLTASNFHILNPHLVECVIKGTHCP